MAATKTTHQTLLNGKPIDSHNYHSCLEVPIAHHEWRAMGWICVLLVTLLVGSLLVPKLTYSPDMSKVACQARATQQTRALRQKSYEAWSAEDAKQDQIHHWDYDLFNETVSYQIFVDRSGLVERLNGIGMAANETEEQTFLQKILLYKDDDFLAHVYTQENLTALETLTQNVMFDESSVGVNFTFTWPVSITNKYLDQFYITAINYYGLTFASASAILQVVLYIGLFIVLLVAFAFIKGAVEIFSLVEDDDSFGERNIEEYLKEQERNRPDNDSNGRDVRTSFGGPSGGPSDEYSCDEDDYYDDDDGDGYD